MTDAMKTEIEVSRSNIRETALVSSPLAPLGANDALLQIEGFALTANNVTYAATGEVIGYWKFFPLADASKGVVPVWGFARVLKSNSPDLAVGTRLYGFFPMATHLVITPKTKGKTAVLDTAPHRRALPPVYNAYIRSPESDEREDALKSIFYPLLLTSYLLFDFLKDNAWFGARQIIVSSASSKTGLGLCQYLSEAHPEGPRIIGLTSAKNREFVIDLDFCDQVVTYDNITTDISRIPSVYVDMAGDAAIRNGLHHHLGDYMRHSAAVGTSHWDKFEPTGEMPGARPRFFFAPSQVEKRRADWGEGVVEQKLEGAWHRVAEQSVAAGSGWMTLKISHSLTAAQRIYSDIANGKVSPREGHYIRL